MPESGFWPAKLLQRLQSAERLLCSMAFLLLVSILFIDVAGRTLVGTGFYWASQLGVWANIVVVMAGFGLATADGAHLRPRFADAWLPRAWEPVLVRLQHLVMSVCCLGLGVVAARVSFESWRLGEISIDLFVPVWPVQLLLPLAFLATACRHTIYLIWPELGPAEQSALGNQHPEDST